MVTMIIIINHRYANHSLYLSNGLARMVSFRSLPDYGPHGAYSGMLIIYFT